MKHELKVGDYVEWKSEEGRARGAILKKLISPMKFKTYTVPASKKNPQYFIKRVKTGLVVMHKGSVLKWIGESGRKSPKTVASSK
jgi:hypothetical protein